MISLVDLIVILAALAFCGGGCSVQILRECARSRLMALAHFVVRIYLKPPRLEAKRSADVRSAEGACGASLSCASGAAKRNCASQGQTCPAEQCRELPPRVGTSLNIYLPSCSSVSPTRKFCSNLLKSLSRRDSNRWFGCSAFPLSPHAGRPHLWRDIWLKIPLDYAHLRV